MKILVISDSPALTTGYSNQIRKINDIFISMGCEVRQIAWGLHEEIDYPYKLYPTPKNDFGKSIFPYILESYLPDVVFSYGDLMNLAWISQYKNRWFKHWCYFPVDTDRLTKTQIAIIESVDLPIVYSRSALYAVTLDTSRLDTKLIYHGLDTELFKPVEDKEALKAQYGLKNKFVVGSVGRNITRKNFPALIKAFAKFAENKDDVVLYLHTKLNDFAGHNLYEFIVENGIQNKVIVTKNLDSTKGVDVDNLVKVYNTFDIMVSTSGGEGLNIPILESQLCEVPVLATDYSACKEFVLKDMRIPVQAYYYEGYQWNLQRAIIDENALVEMLNYHYQNRTSLPSIGKQCRNYIENWDWKYISPLWKLLAIQYGSKDNDIFSDFIKV